ncbi:unnamed protein product [Lactuca virosa]|uniref:Uncharacterized protein n=1 Tax=Lactuca virosa TaxID=75947 RepID=A0AAU9N8Y9_9ASTR|nr:unnamed protein product [Lactuca virosa]
MGKESGKTGFSESNLHVYGEDVHRNKCVIEDIPYFNLGIEDKVNTGVDSDVIKNFAFVGICSSSVKGNVINSHDISENVKKLENDMISSRPKRSQTVPPVLMSPFVVRAVEIDSNLTKEKNINSN